MSLLPVFVAFDYGRKRLGIAVSSALGTVHPRERLDRTSDTAADIAALAALAYDANAAAAVFGLPHNMDGTTSDMEREVRVFAAAFAEQSKLPVYGCDERLTSEAAETVLRNSDVPARARKARRDSAAACIILQDFLAAAAPAKAGGAHGGFQTDLERLA